MRNFKRFLTLALAVVMVASVFAFGASAAKFTDVSADDAYLAKAVNLLNYVGVVKGVSETEFGTEQNVTREQMAAFIYRLMKKGNSVEGGQNTSTFTDLEDPTFFFMISWANNEGIIKGRSATTFDPKGTITLQEAYAMVIRALGYEKEETLNWPFDYIEAAEKDGVNLDEGLASDISYTDTLTRGDVAIILYNAFFAETGVAETTQKEVLLGEGTDAATWIIKTVTEYPTFCEKYFDVIEVEYQAIATPNVTFNKSAANLAAATGAIETTASLGYDAVLLQKVDKDDYSSEAKKLTAEVYVDVADLAITGSANDYIMSHFRMYVTTDKKDAAKIDEILFAEPLMTKKTVTDIKFEATTAAKKSDYYDYDTFGEKAVKLLTGKVTLDGEVAYLYNAPYSYIQPTYAAGSSAAGKYLARNTDNLKKVEFAMTDYKDSEYAFTASDLFTFGDFYADINDDEMIAGAMAAAHEAVVAEFEQAYTGGLYEADIYDVDGDGIYDYINYMPYSFAFVDTDEDYDFRSDAIVEDVVYTNEAILAGEKFENEDLIIGYFNNDANYIKVAAVVEPVTGTIKDIDATKGVITLSNDKTVSVKDGWKLVANYAQDLEAVGYAIDEVDFATFDSLLSAAAYDAEDAKFYVYKDTVLYQDGIETKVEFNKSNFIVITEDLDNEGKSFESSSFDTTTGKKTNYAFVYVGGETKYVPYDKDAKVWPVIGSDYIGKAAVYTVDGDGLYTFKMLANAYDDSAMGADDYIGINTDAELLKDDKDAAIQFYGEAASGYLKKAVGSRFYFVEDLADTAPATVAEAAWVINADTTIIVKNIYEDNDGDLVHEFVTLTKENLTETLKTELVNVQFVLKNDPDKTDRENLYFLYAEAYTDGELEYEGKVTAKAERIIKNYNTKLDADGKYRVYYETINPYTATVETIAGTKTYKKAADVAVAFSPSNVVTLKGGLVDEDADKVANSIDTDNNYWIIDYDATDKVIEIASVADVTVVGGELQIAATKLISVEDTTVQYAPSGDIKWSGIQIIGVDKLASSDKGLRRSKVYFKDAESAGETVYTKYQRAYICIDEADEEGELDVAKYIVIRPISGSDLADAYFDM